MISSTLIKLYERDLNLLKREIDQYSNEAFLWKVKPGINNSAGNLALHLLGNLNHFIGAILGNTGYHRDRPAEFASKIVNRKRILKEIEQTIGIINKILPQFDDTELNMLYPVPYNDQQVTIGYMLTHLEAHLNYHLGQINYHRRLTQE